MGRRAEFGRKGWHAKHAWGFPVAILYKYSVLKPPSRLDTLLKHPGDRIAVTRNQASVLIPHYGPIRDGSLNSSLLRWELANIRVYSFKCAGKVMRERLLWKMSNSNLYFAQPRPPPPKTNLFSGFGLTKAYRASQ